MSKDANEKAIYEEQKSLDSMIKKLDIYEMTLRKKAEQCNERETT